MRLFLAGFLLSTATMAAPPVDAAKVRAAADAFDAGVAAYKSKDYALAASRFEAADAAVPSAKALRQAIRARSEAGQGSRAATLALQALDRYPNDSDTVKLANETIQKFSSGLYKLNVSCGSPCVIAVGTRAIPGEATTRWVVYLDPSDTSISASFSTGKSSQQKTVSPIAHGEGTLRFEVEEPVAAPPAAVVVPDTAEPDSSESSQQPSTISTTPITTSKGLSPLVFVSGAVVTAALGGVTAWSGLDTMNNPGTEKVREACAGLGESCPEYQQGRDKQLRTNILIGATAATGVTTAIIGLFFTQWKKPQPVRTESSWMIPTVEVEQNQAWAGMRGQF